MNQLHWQLARGGFDEKKILKSHEAVPVKWHAELHMPVTHNVLANWRDVCFCLFWKLCG